MSSVIAIVQKSIFTSRHFYFIGGQRLVSLDLQKDPKKATYRVSDSRKIRECA